MQQVAIAWQLYQLTKSPVSMGLLGLFRIAPVLLFALGGGVVADALDRRRLLIVTQTVLALVSLGLALATLSGQASAATIYGAAFLAGTASAFDAPARQSLVPLLVPREHLPNALSLSAMAWQLGTVAGPALGGVLIEHLGVAPIYFLDALSFGAVIAALFALERKTAPTTAVPISIGAAVEGLRFLGRSPLILTTMILDFVATLFGGAMLLMPIFADDLLGVGARGLGLLYAAQPAGAAVAGVLLSARAMFRRQGRTLLIAVAVYGVAIALFGLSQSLWLSLLLLAISGAADMVSMVIRQTMRQLLTPDELRGRMTSVNMIFFMGGPQLGELEAGLVAGWVGVRASVASGGVLCLIAVLAIAWLVPSLRRYRSAA